MTIMHAVASDARCEPLLPCHDALVAASDADCKPLQSMHYHLLYIYPRQCAGKDGAALKKWSEQAKARLKRHTLQEREREKEKDYSQTGRVVMNLWGSVKPPRYLNLAKCYN